MTKGRLFTLFWVLVLAHVVVLVYMDFLITHEYVDIKYVRERHLFLHLLFLVLFIGLTYWAYRRARHINSELKRLAALAGTNAYSNERTERTLGEFGVALNDILANVLLLSDKRRLKIGAQKVLIEVLQEMVEPFLVVVNIEGLVISYSMQAREQLGTSLQVGHFLGESIANFEIKRYVSSFTVSGDALSIDDKYSCYPIYDEQSMIHYVFILAQDHAMDEHVAKHLEQQFQRVLRKNSVLNSLGGAEL